MTVIRDETNQAWKETWHTLVPIKETMKHKLPFKKKLPSNIATATLLSFVGRKAEVC